MYDIRSPTATEVPWRVIIIFFVIIIIIIIIIMAPTTSDPPACRLVCMADVATEWIASCIRSCRAAVFSAGER
jgi:hypothetical protein